MLIIKLKSYFDKLLMVSCSLFLAFINCVFTFPLENESVEDSLHENEPVDMEDKETA